LIFRNEPRIEIRIGKIDDKIDSNGKNIYFVAILCALANLKSIDPMNSNPIQKMYMAIQMYMKSGYKSNLYEQEIIKEGLKYNSIEFEEWIKSQYRITDNYFDIT
jgi:hypothetical protein